MFVLPPVALIMGIVALVRGEERAFAIAAIAVAVVTGVLLFALPAVFCA